MLCDICGKREAVIHIQQIIGKETIDVHMCRECARKKNIASDGASMNTSIINMVMNLLENKSLNRILPNNVTRCPTCGTKVSEIRNEGKAGCPDCYTEFRGIIRNILGMGSAPLLHTGSISSKLKTYRRILMDRERLKRELEEAVSKEDYETAVIIRDQLKEIEVEIGNNDG